MSNVYIHAKFEFRLVAIVCREALYERPDLSRHRQGTCRVVFEGGRDEKNSGAFAPQRPLPTSSTTGGEYCTVYYVQ
jgi:hypothetical protein